MPCDPSTASTALSWWPATSAAVGAVTMLWLKEAFSDWWRRRAAKRALWHLLTEALTVADEAREMRDCAKRVREKPSQLPRVRSCAFATRLCESLVMQDPERAVAYEKLAVEMAHLEQASELLDAAGENLRALLADPDASAVKKELLARRLQAAAVFVVVNQIDVARAELGVVRMLAKEYDDRNVAGRFLKVIDEAAAVLEEWRAEREKERRSREPPTAPVPEL